jgi:NitT/TauT family transport system ATP-binding protein
MTPGEIDPPDRERTAPRGHVDAVQGRSRPQGGMEPLIRMRQVRRVFPGRRVALDGVDLTVGRSDFVTLLGPSGCGKSTVLRLVSGLDMPTSGEIERDPSIAMEPPGVVFQEPSLMPWATVRRNVELPLTLQGLPRAQVAQRVDAALRDVQLSDAAEAVPRELSGGMKMRVALARALVTRPRLWLLDEPFGALDEITRFALNQLLLGLCHPGGDAPPATTLFVTHSVYEAVFLSTRVVVMARPGRVIDEIAIDEPSPRPDSFRMTPGFAAWCAQVTEALRRATEEPTRGSHAVA